MQSQYNMRNPAVKRLMKEAQELKEPNEHFHAQPLEDNIFEWHFTIRGPEDSDFDNGVYHGRIVLPPEYPMKPPSIILLTPNGRFELNTKICLSISGHHPESWRPSWSIRTALLAIIGFMPTHGGGAIGSLNYTTEERKKLARRSMEWKCPNCGVIKDQLKPVTDSSKKVEEEARELASQMAFTGENKNSKEDKDKKPATAETTSTTSAGQTTSTTTTSTTSTSSNGVPPQVSMPGYPPNMFPGFPPNSMPGFPPSSMPGFPPFMPGMPPPFMAGPMPYPQPFCPPFMMPPPPGVAHQQGMQPPGSFPMPPPWMLPMMMAGQNPFMGFPPQAAPPGVVPSQTGSAVVAAPVPAQQATVTTAPPVVETVTPQAANNSDTNTDGLRQRHVAQEDNPMDPFIEDEAEIIQIGLDWYSFVIVVLCSLGIALLMLRRLNIINMEEIFGSSYGE